MRIRNPAGRVLGAGVLLGDRHVLTCAHVVAAGLPGGLAAGAEPGPGAEVLADIVGQPGFPPVVATVVPRCWAPETDDGRGDVALLELERPATTASDARLRALSLSWDRPVYTFGFPPGVDNGVWVRGVLALWAGPGGEWIQLDVPDPRVPVRGGFSGAGVIDEATGAVLGIVVSALSQLSAGLSWMIPTETILAYLPRVAEWKTGDPSADPTFFEKPDPASRSRGAPEVDIRIADLFGRVATGNVMTLVTGAFDSPVAVAVRDAVAMASRSLPGRSQTTSRPGSAAVRVMTPFAPAATPPLGSIDLAVDVAGRTPGDVAQRIVEWSGRSGSTAADVTPRSLLINRIDRSADPARLVDEVIGPIVARAAELDLRLLLGFRYPSLGLRLTLSAMRVEELGTAEQAVFELTRKADKLFADPPSVLPYAARLGRHLVAVRQVADSGAGDAEVDVSQRLETYEQAVDRRLADAVATRDALDGMLARHRELLGRLTSERHLAAIDGLTEDLVLDELFRVAYELLMSGECDLTEAAAAVERFADERRRRRGGDR